MSPLLSTVMAEIVSWSAKVTICSFGVWLVWRCYQLFARSPLDNIPGPPPGSFRKGNIGSLFDRHGWEYHDHLNKTYGAVAICRGVFNKRVLYIYDHLALQHIVVKDQATFEEPHWVVCANDIIFGPGLLSTLGVQHTKQRKLLNPAFSTAHLRRVTPVFYETVHRLRVALTSCLGDSPKELDILHWMNRTALELIGQGGLGYSFDPLIEDKRHEFAAAIKDLVPTSWALTHWRMLSPELKYIGTPGFRRQLVKNSGHPLMLKAIWVIDTLESTAKKIFEDKKRAIEQGDKMLLHQMGEGSDIMSILLKANLEANEKDKLSDDELMAQVSTMCFAATDTTSTALARILHLLCQHPEAQQRLREELVTARDGQDIPYDQLAELPYLDAVCRETLRLYPPANIGSREAHKDGILPLSNPITGIDGKQMSEIFVPKGTYVMIGIRACNRDETIWGEDAHEWKPERWLSPLPETVAKAKIPGVYSHQMTFLGGARACIGFKFSELEMKVVLSVLLESFRFSLSDKDIMWNFAAPSYPTIGRESNEASMPLIVQKI